MCHLCFKVPESDARFYFGKLDPGLPEKLFGEHIRVDFPVNFTSLYERMIKRDRSL